MLLNGVPPRVQAGADGATIVSGGALRVARASRIETGLRHGPLVTLEAIVRCLLVALTIPWIHVDVPCASGAGRNRIVRHHTIVGRRSSLRVIGALERWRICRDIAVIARVPEVVGVVVVVVRHTAPPVGRIPNWQHREEPGKARTVVDTGPEPSAPVTTSPVASVAAYSVPARMPIVAAVPARVPVVAAVPATVARTVAR